MTLESILEAMRAREQATARYHTCLTTTIRGEPAQLSFFSRDGDRIYWRTNADGRERIFAWNGEKALQISRPIGGSEEDWEGTLSPERTMAGRWTPDDFGLRIDGEPFSELLARGDPDVTGSAKSGDFDCVWVNFYIDGAPHIAALSKEHGYYPVRLTELDKGATKRVRFEVQELLASDDGWIAARATAGQPPTVAMKVTPGSHLSGTQLTETYFQLQHVQSATVDGKRESLEELQDHLQGAPPWELLWVLLGLAGVAAGAWMLRRRPKTGAPRFR